MERSDMRLIARTATWTAVLIGVAVTGFFGGRTATQHLKTGYHFKLIDDRQYPYAPDASLHLQHATKSVQLPFLDPETSLLILDDDHSREVTLYEAKRGFQESYPYVKDITVKGDDITWTDGRYSYRLTINLLASAAESQTNN